MEKETIKPVVLHPKYAATMALPDKPGSIRVMCHMCDGVGCKESITCQSGTEVLALLEIKVGHRYSTRSGDVVEITRQDAGFVFPFAGVRLSDGAHVYYKENGMYGSVESEYDLMFELPYNAAIVCINAY